jgi:hypothetical protein
MAGATQRKARGESMSAKAKSETVNHPAHYNAGSIEVIDAIDDWKLSFCLGNSVKYIARAKHKGRELEDLKKALWYLQHEIANKDKECKS